MKRAVIILVISVMLITSACRVVVTEPESQDDAVAETTSQPQPAAADPRDDYYRYINEAALADAEFDYGAMTAAEGLDQHIVDEQLHELFDRVMSMDGYEPGTEEFIIKNAYEQYMSYEGDHTPQELRDLIGQIDEIQSVDEFMALDATLLRDHGVGSVLNYQTIRDPFVRNRNSLIFYQYTDLLNVSFEDLENNTFGLVQAQLLGKTAMMIAGHDAGSAVAAGTDLAYMVFDIQRGSGELIMDDPDVYGYASSLSADEMRRLFTNFDFDAYMDALGLTAEQYVTSIVIDTRQLEALNGVLTQDRLEALKAWKTAELVQTYKTFYAADYGDLLTGFYSVDLAAKEQQAFDQVNVMCTDFVSSLYTEMFYSQETDNVLRSMCDDIKTQYRELISQAGWLSDGTKSGLLRKLDRIVYITGIDDTRCEPSEYRDLIGTDWFETYHNINKRRVSDELESLGSSTDHEPGMPMQMVNACYNPANNDITITVAIMNEPAFSPDNDYWTNLGGLGMVIAHEMGHAFDSNCIRFDENGIYDPDRIPQADLDVLTERDEAAAAYFEDNFTVFGIYHVDGHKTLGENYADLGGMECICAIAQDATQAQREKMFENYARIWCEKVVDSAVTDQILNDEHSPSVIRVNSILSSIQLFYDTYGVSEGDGMYIDPDIRISRWY